MPSTQKSARAAARDGPTRCTLCRGSHLARGSSRPGLRRVLDHHSPPSYSSARSGTACICCRCARRPPWPPGEADGVVDGCRRCRRAPRTVNSGAGRASARRREEGRVAIQRRHHQLLELARGGGVDRQLLVVLDLGRLRARRRPAVGPGGGAEDGAGGAQFVGAENVMKVQEHGGGGGREGIVRTPPPLRSGPRKWRTACGPDPECNGRCRANPRTACWSRSAD